MFKKLETIATYLTLALMCYVAITIAVRNNGKAPATAEAAPTPKAVKLVGIDAEPSLGSDKAPYTVVIFSDYKCPYCKKAQEEIVPEIRKQINAGKVRYIFEDFPLSMHKGAEALAEAARCAHDYGSYQWTFTQEGLFNTGVVPATYQDCVEVGKHKEEVAASISRGKDIGVTGTPTFIVGKTIPGGVDGKMYMGSINLSSLIK